MDLAFDRGVFGGQPERIPAHRVEHAFARHPLVSGVRIGDGVVADVAHVEVARGVGEHAEDVARVGGVVGDPEDPRLLPEGLPLLFDVGMVVGVLLLHESAALSVVTDASIYMLPS